MMTMMTQNCRNMTMLKHYYHDVVISSTGQAKCRIMCNLKMNLGNNSCVNKCKVDSGGDGNLLPISVYKHLVVM